MEIKTNILDFCKTNKSDLPVLDNMTPEEKVKFIYRSCINKKNFTEEGANAVVDKLSSQGILMYFYKCQLCNAFHLTSKPPLEDVDLNVA